MLFGKKEAEHTRSARDLDPLLSLKVPVRGAQITMAQATQRTTTTPLQPPAEPSKAHKMIADCRLAVALAPKPCEQAIQDWSDDRKLVIPRRRSRLNFTAGWIFRHANELPRSKSSSQ
jgi:hypothetical protein